MARIVVCDDEPLIRLLLAKHLTSEGYEVHEAKDGLQCLNLIQSCTPDALLLDLKMPGLDGVGVLTKLQEIDLNLAILIITGFGAINSAVEATKLGAKAYIQKPFNLRDVTFQIEKALKDNRLAFKIHHLENRQFRGYGKLVGESQALIEIFSLIDQLAKIPAPTVLITGESGTGKDLVARTIHMKGQRKNELFMEIDCAALPEHLVESELFGHEKGAFTDAKQLKRGMFEAAEGGTVFLDEIGEMPVTTQAKLLRALENRKFKRLGGLTDIQFDAAVIAASNQDLRKKVKDGGFRQDLFYRLNVVPIKMPALRESLSDIPLLVKYFIDLFNRQFGQKISGVSQSAIDLLRNYSWPGNVRELKNVLERAIIISGSNSLIAPGVLPSEIRKNSQFSMLSQPQRVLSSDSAEMNLDQAEQKLLLRALEQSQGNQTKSAKLLGISRFALRYRMQKYGIYNHKINS